ncbi:MAG: zf-TFIIB domain-containing protein [Myxococcales bacterium]|nr:zf-TFIIB domain-containing protein [Myxococcales bacterium]
MWIACTSCHLRHDVSSYVAGERVACKCGTSLDVPTKPPAGVLRCPTCHGAVPQNAIGCSFCRAPLMLKACPRCFARLFLGTNFCNHCGADAAELAPHAGTHAARQCPRCVTPKLAALLVGDVCLEQCERCHGIFVDRSAIEQILQDREQARADAILGALPRGDAPAPTVPPGGKLYIPCPDCKTMMNRTQFADGARIIVDVCRTHGTWFDSGELPRMVDFVQTGGLEQAAKRRLEREKQNITRQAEEARRLAALPADVGYTRNSQARGPSLGDIADILKSLLS